MRLLLANYTENIEPPHKPRRVDRGLKQSLLLLEFTVVICFLLAPGHLDLAGHRMNIVGQELNLSIDHEISLMKPCYSVNLS